MVTADDEQTTDIIIEGDPEELERFCKASILKWRGELCCHTLHIHWSQVFTQVLMACFCCLQELNLQEKGMVRVKGLLE